MSFGETVGIGATRPASQRVSAPGRVRRRFGGLRGPTGATVPLAPRKAKWFHQGSSRPCQQGKPGRRRPADARHPARILPVDSAHSAIFQALTGEDIATVERITLTASGGALRDWPLERLARTTLAETLSHRNWAMGQRMTIDSASQFNKAMELIETRAFFGVQPDQIEVIIHPESRVHALVGFCDGATMAHLGAPDMRHAVGYALNRPHRQSLPVPRLDLAALGSLTFRASDLIRFPALRLAREVMATRGRAGAAFTAAREVALDLFIAGRIGFMDMAGLVEATLVRISAEISLAKAASGLDDVMQVDHLARIRAREIKG